MSAALPLVVYIPDRRDVEISGRFTAGNNKIGYSVFTYSRLAGRENRVDLRPNPHGGAMNLGTCPGSTDECERICYAKRIQGAVRDIYVTNSLSDDVPPIPDAAQLVRIHVSGDFDSVAYIKNWIARLLERPDVTCWAYTRSWRVPALLPALEELRALPNMQLFASMDVSHSDVPPTGWRRAWIDGDPRAGTPMNLMAHHADSARLRTRNFGTFDGTMSYICPEETKHKANCVECGYCFEGQKNDVTFLKH